MFTSKGNFFTQKISQPYQLYAKNDIGKIFANISQSSFGSWFGASSGCNPSKLSDLVSTKKVKVSHRKNIIIIINI